MAKPFRDARAVRSAIGNRIEEFAQFMQSVTSGHWWGALFHHARARGMREWKAWRSANRAARRAREK
jgi:hypothetical protein